MAVKKLILDIMLHDRFVCTLRMPVTRDMIIVETIGGGKTEEYIDMDKVLVKVLEKRPTLKNKPYRICF